MAGVARHGAELAAERRQPIRHPLLPAGRLFLHVILSLLEQVPALTPGLCRDTRGLLPGSVSRRAFLSEQCCGPGQMPEP